MTYIDKKNSTTKNKKLNYESFFYNLAFRGRLSSNLVGFCRFLRMNGLYTSMAEQIDAMSALEKLDLQDEDAFRIALRVTLAKSYQEQEIFDKYFRQFWYVWESFENLDSRIESKTSKTSTTVRDERPNKQGFVSINDWLDNNQSLGEKEAAGYSPFKSKSERDFTSFQAEELEEIMYLINEIGKKMANRLSLRKIKAKKKGSIDFKKTVRNSLRRGGEILELFYYKKRRKRLKLVLLCDVSKSMDLYSRFFVQFIYAFQCVFKRIETFVFSTSLHRITETLKTEEINVALENLSRTIPEWSGGTKIGFSLEQFVENYGTKIVDSQTICIIISDGWDTGDVELLERNMSFLKNRSRNIIWLNPLKGSPEYEPTTRGMQAALPYIDIFSSAHNLNSLKNFANQLI